MSSIQREPAGRVQGPSPHCAPSIGLLAVLGAEGWSRFPGIPAAQSTHLEITFRQTAEGTEITLIHDGWEARGADAMKMWESYQTGWDLVLGRILGSARVKATS